MKIYAYEVREDELEAIEKEKKKWDIEVEYSKEVPSLENAELAEGCVGISILGQGNIGRELLDKYSNMGIMFISTRTIGYNHIDVNYAKSVGIRVCNAAYAPNGVSEFTIMMILMCLRNYKQAMWRGKVNDFALNGLQGRELKDLTVGVIGTGKIGAQVIKNLTGFGCKIYAHDIRKNNSIEEYVTYTDLDTIYGECDIITLHTPLLDSTWHMINMDTINKMRDGVIIINCARGELADIEALIYGIESEKIGALGIDTLEGEEGIIHSDHRTDILPNRNWFYLHQFRNVIMTQHMAFYTDAAVESMVDCGISGIVKMARGMECETEI